MVELESLIIFLVSLFLTFLRVTELQRKLFPPDMVSQKATEG